MDTTNTNALSDEPEPKRRNLDKFSELPDSIILHILSYLPLDDALRCSILSKRFQWLWISLTSLDFINTKYYSGTHRFVNFVNETLTAIETPCIDRFTIELCFSEEFTFSINSWIEFATERKVKSLRIDLKPLPLVYSYYRFYQILYDNSYLTDLRVNYCEFVPMGRIRWPSLKILVINHVNLSDQVFKNILSGCPVLESLELGFWRGLNRLKINSNSLRTLKFFEQKDAELLRISAPYLQTLQVSGRFWGELKLRNLTSLVSATIDLEMEDIRKHNKKHYQKMLRGILENLSHVRNITLGNWCIQALSSCVHGNISPPLLNYQSLTLLHTNLLAWECLALSSLLHSSPYQESLIIKILWDEPKCRLDYSFSFSNQFSDENFWATQKMKYGCLLHHLKLVKIVYNRESGELTPLLDFLGYLLSNGPVLEKIIIQRPKWFLLHNSPVSHYILEQKLQEMSRVSSCVEFLFESSDVQFY